MSVAIPPTRHAEIFNYPTLSRAQIDQYRELGYVNLGQVLTDHGLKLMRDQVMAAWLREKEPFDPQRTWLQNSLLGDIHLHSDVVRKYYYGGPQVDAAEQLVGPNIKSCTCQLTFKLHGNSMDFDWHQDNVYGELDPYNALTTITAMDDSDRENGCIWLIPGSHKAGQAKFERSSEDHQTARPVVLKVDDSQAVPAQMKAGECLVFHCHMLHYSQGNLSADRDRRLMLCRYSDADAVEVYNDRRPRLGRLLRGTTRFAEVRDYEADIPLN